MADKQEDGSFSDDPVGLEEGGIRCTSGRSYVLNSAADTTWIPSWTVAEGPVRVNAYGAIAIKRGERLTVMGLEASKPTPVNSVLIM